MGIRKTTSLIALSLCVVVGATPAAEGAEILYVANDAQRTQDDDRQRIALFQQWGHDVAVISAHANSEQFQTAIALADVIYIAQNISSSALGYKLRGAPRGVVSEEFGIADAFGLLTSNGEAFVDDSIGVVHEGHAITGPFGGGWLRIMREEQMLNRASGGIAPGVAVLAEDGESGAAVFFVIDAGDRLLGGEIAPARRVFLPWGPTPESFASLTNDGRAILRRSIDWAAGYELSGQRLDAGLKAHFSFDNPVGDRVIDEGGARAMRLAYGAQIDSAGVVGAAVRLSGDDDHLVLDEPAIASLQSGAISLWINPDDVRERQTIVQRVSATRGMGFAIRLQRGRLIADADDMRRDGEPLSHKLRPGDWRHIVVTFRPDSVALYLDGENIITLVRAISVLESEERDAPSEILIGACARQRTCFNGMIDEVRIFGRPLMGAEARDLFALKPAPDSAPGRAGEYAGRQ